ncbi:YggS family pyridoxal phosphate-dependent enzyme [Massilia sp. W12]|uniref:YggS family pyridoxal phosphate-dependent enzyme n=1 Tax=Massilia sp. W12 TaxID=3126507 RepID=UPI0030CC2F1B
MFAIRQNLQAVHERISAAASAAGRPPESVRLLAVSKTFDAAAVRMAYEAGQIAFGENYLQEALEKQALLQDLPLEWHFIGPLQSNKTRPAAEHFAWVHTVDRLKIAERLSAQRPSDLPPLNICLQVNISGEASKSGIAPADLPALAAAVAGLPQLRLRGLMAIPAPAPEAAPEVRRAPFAQMRALFEQLRAEYGAQPAFAAFDTLSMGMSDDLEDAVAQGANLVRIGSAIFGKRHYPA